MLLNVLLFPSSWLSTLLATRGLVAVGKISYALYLWHIPVLLVPLPEAVSRLVPPASTGQLVARLGVAVLLAIVSRRVIERPFLRWKASLPSARPARRGPIHGDAASVTSGTNGRSFGAAGSARDGQGGS
jgi:peptidoglycan/LPS O-acetylase OafA/YrhL